MQKFDRQSFSCGSFKNLADVDKRRQRNAARAGAD